MDPSLVKQALEAVEKGDAKAALDILKGLIASAAGADPDDDGDEPGSEGDGAEGQPSEADETATEAVEDPKVVDASADPDGDDGEDDDDGDEDEDAPPKKKAARAARKAMRAELVRLTGASSMAEALATVATYRASHLTLETERQKLAKDRATLESAERRTLCVDLVKLGAEFPATIWKDPTSKTPSGLKARWAKMPIEELRSHVAEQRAARGKSKAKTSREITPAGGDGSEVVELSAAELKICEQTKCDPKVFASLKALRDGAAKKG